MVDADDRLLPAGGGAGRRPEDEVRQRRLARGVTWSLVGVLLLVGAAEHELWPLTAYRLFSNVRTGTGSAIELVAVSHDGTRTPVRLDPRHPVLVATEWQYGRVPDADPAEQRRMVRAWLAVAGIDASDVAEVRVERSRYLVDRSVPALRDTSREVLVAVVP